jgi:hypothetical protein
MSNQIPSLEEFIETKKLNEDVDIPASLSIQYMTVKKQIADKNNQKNLLMKQVAQRDTELGILTKNLIALETKAAQLQGKEVTQQQNKAETKSTATEATAGEAKTNESFNIILDELDKNLDFDFNEFSLDEETNLDDIDILITEEEEWPVENDESDEEAIEELSSDYVFALRINDPSEESEIICKVYRNRDDDFWKIRVVKGTEEPLETMQFDPEMDMVSIIERIGEIYEEVEEVDMDEYEELLDDKEKNDEKYFNRES